MTDYLLQTSVYTWGWSVVYRDSPVLLSSILDETETVEAPTVETPAEAPKEKLSEFEEAKEDANPKDENGGAKPPKEGLCKRCGERRMLNRLRLCYPCFVIWNIEDIEKKAGRKWTSDMPHPIWCDCEGLGEHRNSDGSDKRAN